MLYDFVMSKLFTKRAIGLVNTVGNHAIDQTFVVRLKGTVVKSADYMRQATVEIPLLATLAMVLQRSGIQRETMQTILVECMNQAINNDLEASELIAERTKDIQTAMATVREMIGKIPKVLCSGPTAVNVEMEVVEMPPPLIISRAA